jgi:hypothetical protein
MVTKFIYDPVLDRKMTTVAEILSLANKQPYPTRDATHLASFLGACFKVVELEQRKKLVLKLEAEKKLQWEEQEARKREEEEKALASLDIDLPMPQAPMPTGLSMPGPGESGLPNINEFDSIGNSSEDLEKLAPSPPGDQSENVPVPIPNQNSETGKEYVIRIYDSPVGILIDKNDNDKYVYNVVEPNLDLSVSKTAKKLYRKELEKNNGLFDDEVYLKKVAQKVSKKVDVPMSELFIRKLKYYLERDILGAGPFDPLLFDEKVRTINCAGINKPLKVEIKPYGTISSNVIIKENEEINHLMKRVSEATMKPLDETNPILDATFQGFKFEGIMGIGGLSSKLTIRRLDNDI